MTDFNLGRMWLEDDLKEDGESDDIMIVIKLMKMKCM